MNKSQQTQKVLTAELHRLQEELESDKTLDSSASTQIQRYTTLELISTGGMGEIYRGFDHQCQRPVAIGKNNSHPRNFCPKEKSGILYSSSCDLDATWGARSNSKI